MNYERKDQDDFEDILKNLVPYDEAEDRANSAQEEDLEVFDMSMVENDLSSDYTADNFFITKPEQNKTQAEPEKKNSSDEQSALKVNSETPIYHTEREDSYSNYIPTDSYSPTDGQIEDSNQVDEGMDNSYSEMNNYEDEQVNYGEIDNNHQMNNSYEHYANNGYEQANNEQVNNDYQMNNSYNFSYNPANTQVNNQQEIDNFSYSPTGNETNDNGFEYEHSPADSQARSIQVGDTFEYTPADEQGSQPNINQLSNAADSSGPIRHLNNSLWHDSSADGSSGISHQNKLPENDSNNSAECNNYNSNHEIFQPVPASFNSSPASNWTMEEYFNQEESADDEQSASNSDTINNYVDGFDNYSNDETNSVCNISSSTHSLTPEREVQNNPESIEIAKDEESPHATSTEESSLDELFKDCPPIDPNTFKYQPHQQTQQTYEYPEEQHNYYADQQQTNSYNVDQHSLASYHNDQPTIDYQNELPLASYYNNQPTIDYQNELPLASYYNDQPVDYPVEQSSYTVEEANYEQPLANSYSGQTNYHMDKQTSIPTSPFQHSTKPIPVEPLYTYHLPSSGVHTVPLQTVPETVQSKNKEETEHLSSAPSALIQLAFCSDRLIIASSTGSITNASHLMANPIKTVELQGEIEVVSIKHKSDRELVNELIKMFPLYDSASHPLNYLTTKNSQNISELKPSRAEPRRIDECIKELPQDINTLLLSNNWAEAFFLASSNKKVLETVQYHYGKNSTSSVSDHISLLLMTGCPVPSELFESPDALSKYLQILKYAIEHKRTDAIESLITSLFLHKKTDEAVISILVSGIIGKHIEKLYDLNVLLIYNKINPQEQEQVAKRSKELIKMMKVLNKAKAKEIYKENKDMFSRTDRKEIEDALGIESSAWGIQGIINAVDKGITRMVSTPAPAAVISQQIAEQTPVQNQPAPQTQPVQPVIPMGSSIPTRNVHIKKRTPMMNRPVMPADIIQPKVEPIAHPEVTAIPMPSVSSSVNKPSSAIPMPTIPESMKSKPAATIFMPTIPESIKSKSSTDIPMPSVTPVNKPSNTIPMPVIPESMKSKPAATIPMPVIPESMKVKPEVSSPVDNKLESAVIPAVPGNTTAAPVQPAPIDAADDNIDYKKLYSDKERYQMIESEPERGSWLGYIPGVNAFTGMVKKLARKSDIPVVELSQDTTFIFDKKMKKWITVDSKTLKPIKMEVTQRRPEDKEPILGAAAPKPIAMPVITGKMPKRGADGKVDFGPVGTSLEARYGKPMIQSSIDTTMTDAAPGFPMPQGLYTRKNAKVFIPQAPQPEDECTK